jgi:probable HAF family extracellular repeat protein
MKTLHITSLLITLGVTTNVKAYDIIDLGTLGGANSYGYGINSSGHVTGFSDSPLQRHAFLYDGTSMKDLVGTQWYGATYAEGINDSDQVVGYGAPYYRNDMRHGFITDGTQIQDISTLAGVIDPSWATAISNNGHVTGSFENLNLGHAFLYDGSNVQDLGTLGGNSSRGQGINDIDQVVGWSTTSGGGSRHAFLYDNGSMQDLGTLGGSSSEGFDINIYGQITGKSDIFGNSATHAFLYDANGMQDLGTLGGSFSTGNGINSSGYVVGQSGLLNGDSAAFLFDGSQMYDLCVLVSCKSKGWDSIYTAADINDNGYITGTGIINGVSHAFIISTVPLPAATWLFVSGLVGLIGFAKRKAQLH